MDNPKLSPENRATDKPLECDEGNTRVEATLGKGQKMNTLIAFLGAALMEIAGCFAFWAWLRLHKSPFWLIPGIAALALFAYLLTLVDSPFAGRAYAAYGGIYIVCALVWGWVVEGNRPDQWMLPGPPSA